MHSFLNAEGSRARIIMIRPDSEELEYSLRFEFSTTNNDVEHEAVIISLDLVTRLGVSLVEVCSDMQLIVRRVLGSLKERMERWQRI